MNPLHEVGRWAYSVPAHGWCDPYELPWRISEICDVNSWRWATEAACADTDPDIWFAPETRLDRALLTAICGRCPVRAECLERALFSGEHGWWAGTTRKERNKMLRDIARMDARRETHTAQ